jgi:hypothetical protein
MYLTEALVCVGLVYLGYFIGKNYIKKGKK